MQKQLPVIIEREGDGYVSFCPELDIASQGGTIQEACENLREALELSFEAASPDEIHERLHEEVYAIPSHRALRDNSPYLDAGSEQLGRMDRDER